MSDRNTGRELIGMIKNNQLSAFDALYQKYHYRLEGDIAKICRSWDKVDDIAQLAWIKAFEGIDTFAERSGFYTWLYRIAVNEYLSVLRRSRRRANDIRLIDCREDILDKQEDKRLNPEERLIAKDLLLELCALVLKMGKIQRDVFVCRFLRELSLEETGKTLGIAERTVNTRTHRLRKILAKLHADKLLSTEDKITL